MSEVVLLRMPSEGDTATTRDPPISQGLVAAALHAQGIDAKVVDLSLNAEAGLGALLAQMDEPGLKVVGISAYQSNIERSLRLADSLKKHRSDVKIVLGGPQVTHMPPDGLAEMVPIDALCQVPGEVGFPAFIEALRERTHAVPGWLVRTPDGSIERHSPGRWSTPPSPSPYLTAQFAVQDYPVAVVFSSRGCPYNCDFCYTPAASGRRMQYESIDRVVQEIECIATAGVREVFFADPIFVVERERTLVLLERLKDFARDMAFTCEMRIEMADPLLLEKMKEAGFNRISFGLESVSATVLERIKKPMEMERFEVAIKSAIALEVGVELFCLYGLPEQRLDDVRRTFDFVESFGPAVQAAVEPQQLQLYFGTAIAAKPQDYGIEVIGSRPAYLSPGTHYRTRWLGPEEFYAIEEEWERRSHPAKALVGIGRTAGHGG